MCSFSETLDDHGLSHSSLSSVFTSVCITRIFLGAAAGPRQHPAAFRNVQRPSGGGKTAPRGESLRDSERLAGPGASAGRCDGFLFPLWRLFYFLNIEQGNWRCGDIQKGILFYDILQTQHCFRQFKL